MAFIPRLEPGIISGSKMRLVGGQVGFRSVDKVLKRTNQPTSFRLFLDFIYVMALRACRYAQNKFKSSLQLGPHKGHLVAHSFNAGVSTSSMPSWAPSGSYAKTNGWYLQKQPSVTIRYIYTNVEPRWLITAYKLTQV